MKKSVGLAILSLVFVSNAVRAQAPARLAERVTVIPAGALIDGTGGAPRKNQLIFVRGQRLEKGADRSAQSSAGAAGVCSVEGYARERDVGRGAQLVDGPVEARKAARQEREHGADWIKVYMTHRSWVDKQGNLVSQPTLTLEELKAVVDETHGWGKKVACHAYNGIGLQRALDGGCDSIEHGLEVSDRQIAQMGRRGAGYCTTISPYHGDWERADT